LRAGKSVTAARLPDPQSDTPTQATITTTPPPSPADFVVKLLGMVNAVPDFND